MIADGTKKRLDTLARDIRLYDLKMSFSAGKNGSHLGGSLSAAEIMAALYGGVLNFDPNDPASPKRDRFILSKGHTAAVLYAALRAVGVLTDEDIASYNMNGTEYPSHCIKNINKGIELSSGSLGLGAGYAAGLGLAFKKQNNPAHIFVLMGDGECAEGSVWEALTAIPALGLDNITVIIDKNRLQLDGETIKVLDTGDLSAKLTAFGWDAAEADGHDVSALCEALAPDASRTKPRAVIAHTVKGKGVSFMENNYKYHHASITEEQYNAAVAEITGAADNAEPAADNAEPAADKAEPAADKGAAE